jgi:hypothetical protein
MFVTSALDAGVGVVAELEISGVWTTEELDSATGAVAELSGCVWVAEDAGAATLESGAACSLDVGVVPPWFTFTNTSVELSSPQAVKRDAARSAPVNAKEMRVFLSIA